MTDSQNTVDEKKCQDWMKLARALKVCLKQSLLDILQNPKYSGLSKDVKKANEQLKKFREENESSLGDALNPDEWNLVSQSGTSNPRGLNVPSLVILIEHLTDLQPPSAGWKQEPKDADISKAAYVLFAKQLRKAVLSGPISSKSQEELDRDWLKAETILKGLEYTDMEVFYYLKDAALDEIEVEQMEILMDKCLMFSQESVNQEKKEDVDMMRREIEILKELVKSYSLNEKEIDEKVMRYLTVSSNSGGVKQEDDDSEDEAVVIEIVAPNEVQE